MCVEWGGTARTLYEIGIMAMRSGKDKHLLACRLTLEASPFLSHTNLYEIVILFFSRMMN